MMPSTTRLPARNAALTTFAAALTCACVIASLATSLALRKAQDDGLVDPALAKLGMTDDRALSPTDLLPGADLRWEFPRLIAAQLEIGESFTFVLPGNRLVDIPLVDRSPSDLTLSALSSRISTTTRPLKSLCMQVA